MKGSIFSIVQEFVEENFGFEAWDAIIEKAELSTDGVFISTETYPDEDLFRIVRVASDMTKLEASTVLEATGKFAFSRLAGFHDSKFVKDCKDMKSFMKTVDSVIHVEVRKLNPDASLPSMDYSDPQSDKLTVIYNSDRKLCHFAVGLIKGASEYFNENIEVDHSKCMHHGSKDCHLDLTFTKVA